jgi:hypothetical protein
MTDQTWLAGVESLGEAGLARPCGEAEGPYAQRSAGAGQADIALRGQDEDLPVVVRVEAA